MHHYNDVIMGAIASQITSLTIVYSIVNSDADQRKHQSSASLAFVRGIHRGTANCPHKRPVTWKMFPFDDVIMTLARLDIPTAIARGFLKQNAFKYVTLITGFFGIYNIVSSNVYCVILMPKLYTILSFWGYWYEWFNEAYWSLLTPGWHLTHIS